MRADAAQFFWQHAVFGVDASVEVAPREKKKYVQALTPPTMTLSYPLM